MSSFYNGFFELVLWVIKLITPTQGPEITNENKWRPNNFKPDKIDTGYGFPIDQWSTSIKFLDSLFYHIPIYDSEPTIDPQTCKEYLDRTYGNRVPIESNDPVDLITFLTKDTGSYFLKSLDDNTYVVDFSDYEQYNVRDGLEKYGGKVFIRDDQIVGYEYLGEKYSSTNQRMDKIIRSSLCLKMMVQYHALRIHLCTAQRKTYEYYDKYDENHPLAEFLYLSTYATFDVNRRIPILVSPHGLVVRLFGLTQESYQQLLNDILAQSEFSRKEILGQKGTVWNKEMSKYTELVDNLISEFTEDEIEREDLANFFITASAMHNQFGDAQIYGMTISRFFLPKVYIERPGFVSNLDQNLLIILLISVSARYPLIIDEHTPDIFSNLKQRKAWEKFQKEIMDNYPNKNWFDVRSMEISVGF
jgi:hypothetical protein